MDKLKPLLVILVPAIIGFAVIWALKRFAPSIASKIPGVGA